MARGLVVDRGKHTIEMRYLPWSVIVGAGMSLIGTALAAFTALRSRRQVYT